RLVKVWQRPLTGGRFELSPPNFSDYKAQAHSFSAIGAFHGISVSLVGQGEPQKVSGSALTGDVLPILGVKPLIGRAFTDSDDRSGYDGNVILSYGLWQRNYGGDPAVLGTKIVLGGEPREVLGVMPKDFH